WLRQRSPRTRSVTVGSAEAVQVFISGAVFRDLEDSARTELATDAGRAQERAVRSFHQTGARLADFSSINSEAFDDSETASVELHFEDCSKIARATRICRPEERSGAVQDEGGVG